MVPLYDPPVSLLDPEPGTDCITVPFLIISVYLLMLATESDLTLLAALYSESSSESEKYYGLLYKLFS